MKKKFSSAPLMLLYSLASALWRLVPHWPNMTPFTALALYSGCQQRSWRGLITPLIPLALTDLYLGFHITMPFVYGSLLLIGLLGRWYAPQRATTLIATALVSSLIFFIITNVGVWLVGNLYPHTAAGLMTALTLALPFYQNALIGDLLFSSLFFGGNWLLAPGGHGRQPMRPNSTNLPA